MKKISYCGESLQAWGRDYTSNFKQRIGHCKREIQHWKKGCDDISIQKFREAELNFSEVMNQQEVFWRQRSKQLWLQEGDSDSKYFHAKATSRKKHNTIIRLMNDVGDWVTWEDELPNVMVALFH
ncbi:uncharacterized protein LOC115696538 [Cannabis sativa]|uniref:uncharacterized protein LOC115696538 n=1 Tax=Cannabis sativa TaxID=3483 RepID=UPI0011E04408|nr:uncharacterized protein LOC115696538 [Cannabis sativa]